MKLIILFVNASIQQIVLKRLITRLKQPSHLSLEKISVLLV